MNGPVSLRTHRLLSEEERHEILQGRHILVVDDDDLARRALARLLAIEGCATTLVGSLAEAQQSHEGRVVYDAAIVDYWLVGENGPALVRWLREAPTPCSALLITGSRSPAIGREAIAAGAEDCLVKPFSPPDLLDSLARTVARTMAWRQRLAAWDAQAAVPARSSRRVLDAEAESQRAPRPLQETLELPPGTDLGGVLESLVRDGNLSDQQREVLRMLLDGASMREISEAVDISPRTVKYHAAIIYDRLGVANKSELFASVLDRFAPAREP